MKQRLLNGDADATIAVDVGLPGPLTVVPVIITTDISEESMASTCRDRVNFSSIEVVYRRRFGPIIQISNTKLTVGVRSHAPDTFMRVNEEY
mmetsp:Transcript_15359/g.19586  ORF Transcript_15359/g.19586 Transcript_15359/m.19586 type:complete len:92 (-) Transcript_15359:264-539(-)